MSFDLPAAIDEFRRAAQRGDHFPPDWYDRLDINAAYRIQLGLIARHCDGGARRIGWKVGLTAPAIQQQFGFHIHSFDSRMMPAVYLIIAAVISLVLVGGTRQVWLPANKNLSRFAGEVEAR